MKIISLLMLSLISLLIGCNSKVQNDKKYIYYLHGRIIEIQGKNAVSEVYGKYEFDSIVNALRDSNTEVIAEIRSENVDYLQYANKISKEIDSLLNLGINPIDITVIGASKGAIIASNISSTNSNPINYVFLAGNNDYQEEHNDWKFHGQVLCFYDESDTIAGKNYGFWKNKSNFTTKFEQIKISKKLGHGFLYKPYKEWV
jgi:predicted esterase